ncbi:hypothetical protein ACQKM2_23205 [Streptomyces sp. NPDC004126]|uniref:hypothetical protein n=1 Tax=Streptomyces sp. NPDC004126 TaxID=3390695 RepID=UPI003CFBF021
MRLRTAVPAVMGALLLTLAMPSSANAAAIGIFTYRAEGHALPLELVDPPNEECIDVPGATDVDPARNPRNGTLSRATVFLDFGCQGDTFYVMNPGKVLGNRLTFRSVIFG